MQWRFNPPSAPHFGSLWEAAVKSLKHHLRRVLGESTLTYEEMSTFLTQIESCMNSRPLQALSDDPDDLTALTPGHFLVGTALNALPEPCLVDAPIGRLSLWQLLQKMRDHFWDRWSREYLHSLFQRPKWNCASRPFPTISRKPRRPFGAAPFLRDIRQDWRREATRVHRILRRSAHFANPLTDTLRD
ncbi:hypothetical protein ACFW04_014841 [Cataglyphis niger]